VGGKRLWEQGIEDGTRSVPFLAWVMGGRRVGVRRKKRGNRTQADNRQRPSEKNERNNAWQHVTGKRPSGGPRYRDRSFGRRSQREGMEADFTTVRRERGAALLLTAIERQHVTPHVTTAAA